MVHLPHALTASLLLGLGSAAEHCRCRPSDPCWPSTREWTGLNHTVHGRLFALRPVGSVCHGKGYDADACANVQRNMNDSGWLSDQPGTSTVIVISVPQRGRDD